MVVEYFRYWQAEICCSHHAAARLKCLIGRAQLNLNIHLIYNCINIHVKYAIVLQFLKRVTLHVGVIYHRMDDIVQCLFNLHIK